MPVIRSVPACGSAARDRVTRDGISLDEAVYSRMSRSKAWGHLGDLKRELLDLWTEERNTLAKEVMQDIEAQRRKAKGR